ncbi:hypothetical protein evm_003693 [Chilo suppressalis]|nr:hypothetical protein evm_003693 [Chilo suppressalis]
MRIRHFAKNVEVNELKKYELKDCDVVIDGQNFLYNIYEMSGLPFEFGCESDIYAEHLRKKLSVFINANVKCYFFFKCGHSDMDKKKKKQTEKAILSQDPNSSTNFILPIFMKEIYKQVLDEMNFNYVFCEFECKKDCIALAQKLNCPIISYDIEFCFAGVPYIPIASEKNIVNDKSTGGIPCGLFVYEDFTKKYNLNKEKLATFIVLTNENLFPEGHFKTFFDAVHIRGNPYRRNAYLLNWLSKEANHNTIESIMRKCFRADEYDTYRRERNRIIGFICKEEEAGVPVDYLLHDKYVEFTDNDPLWFEKGVVCGYISLQYVDMYHWNIIDGSWCLEDEDAEDALFISLDIIKYAFNLLTNYERKEINFHNKKDEVVTISVTDATAVPKPTYTAVQSPFENGWDLIKPLGLFEHFLEKCMPETNFSVLNTVPENARLLIITLIYFSRHKTEDTTIEVCSALLSYVMLSVVKDKSNNNNHMNERVSRTIIEPFTDENLVTDVDCNIATDRFAKYFTVLNIEKAQFDEEILHPLVEFQHCLQQINLLNKLCGSPFEETMYSRTYNGTLVYKIAHTIKGTYSGVALDFIDHELSSAVTVLGFFNGLRNVYDEIMYRTFDELLGIMSPRITLQDTNMRSAIPAVQRLAVTLRFLATGHSFHDLHYQFLIGVSTIHYIVKQVCDAIWDCLMPIYMAEKTSDDFKNISEEFYHRTNFPNLIGAVDSKHIEITKPDESGSLYYNYKNYFSLVLMAICDANYCFTCIEVGAYGGSSDSNVFKNTLFHRRLESGQIELPQPKILPNDINGKLCLNTF